MSAPVKQSSSWLAVYNGTTCIGHAIYRGRIGIEAFNVDDESISLFATFADATAALDSLAVPS
jgi:hypothetical protein